MEKCRVMFLPRASSAVVRFLNNKGLQIVKHGTEEGTDLGYIYFMAPKGMGNTYLSQLRHLSEDVI